MNNPKIIILDEPTASLDKFYRRKIINKLLELSKKDNLIIMSSHNSEDLEKFCVQADLVVKLGADKVTKEMRKVD